MRRLLKLLLLLVVLLVLLAIGWYFTHREEARGLRAALIVASTVEEIPVLGRVALWGTTEPRAARSREAGALPAILVRPASGGKHPAVVLLVPEGTTSAEADQVRTVQRGLARAGANAWAVRVPDRGLGLSTPASRDELGPALTAIATDSSSAGRQVSIVAVGGLASEVLVAAADPAMGRQVRAVLAVQPVADLRGVLQLAVIGRASGADGSTRPHPAAATARRAAGEAIVGVLQRHAEAERSPLAAEIVATAARSDDPIETLRQVPVGALSEDLRRVRAVLDATDARSFDAAWRSLPVALAEEAASVSPAAVARRLRARVLLAVPRDDSGWPAVDAERLERLIPDARMARSPVLDPDGGTESIDASALRALADDAAWWLARALEE